MRPGTQREQPKHVHAYEVWYSCGKDFTRTFQTLQQNPAGFKWPADVSSLYRWTKDYDWEGKARLIDAELAKARMDKLIKEQQQFLERQRNAGRILQREAMRYLNSDLKDPKTGEKIGRGIDNSATAVAALKSGFEMERNSMALPDIIVELLNTDPETLRLLYERTRSEIAESSNAGTGYEDQGSEAEAFPPTAIGPVSEDSNDPA